MSHSTVTALLAAVVLLGAVVIVQATRPAEAGGIASSPESTADIGNNGTVNVDNFFDLLAAWGTCPSRPRVVAMASFDIFVTRLWSDNTLEFTMAAEGPCSECEESIPQLGEWLRIEAPPQPALAAPVDTVISYGPDFTFVAVTYSDGSAYRREWYVTMLPDCTDPPDVTWTCEFVWVGDWTEFGEL